MWIKYCRTPPMVCSKASVYGSNHINYTKLTNGLFVSIIGKLVH